MAPRCRCHDGSARRLPSGGSHAKPVQPNSWVTRPLIGQRRLPLYCDGMRRLAELVADDAVDLRAQLALRPDLGSEQGRGWRLCSWRCAGTLELLLLEPPCLGLQLVEPPASGLQLGLLVADGVGLDGDLLADLLGPEARAVGRPLQLGHGHLVAFDARRQVGILLADPQVGADLRQDVGQRVRGQDLLEQARLLELVCLTDALGEEPLSLRKVGLGLDQLVLEDAQRPVEVGQLADQLRVAALDGGQRRRCLVDPLADDRLVGVDAVELVGGRIEGVLQVGLGAAQVP